jgi:hypothetical protein
MSTDIDLSDVIEALGTDTYVVTRSTSAQGDDGHGRVAAGAITTLPIVASIQPASGRVLERLPEGERSGDFIRVWTATPLQTTDATTGLAGDTLVYKGKSYQVEQVNDWSESGNFCDALARQVRL